MRSRLVRGPVAALALMFAVGAAPTARADIKLGYIDSARIFLEYKPAQDAQAQFDRQVQGWRTESTEKEKAVNTLRAEVRDQAPILSTLKRQEKEEALQRAISDYEKFVQDIWGPEGRAYRENERATLDIVRQIRAVVEKIAQERDLDIVLDAASGFILYADRTLDITPAVLTELAAQATAGGPR